MKKILILLLVAIMGMALFTGCNKEEDVKKPAEKTEIEKSVDKGSEKNEDKESQKKITISMLSFAEESSALYEPYNESVEKFSNDNPNVDFQYEYMPQDAYMLKINTLAAANELPDIGNTVGSMTRSFAATGVLRPLTKYYENDAEWKAKIPENSFLEHKHNGDIYGIPYNKGNYGYMFYNTEIFKEVGIDSFPANIEEFYDACEKIKAAGYTPIALGDKPLWPADSITFSTFVNKYVGNEWYEDIFYKTGKSKFTDQCFIDALTAFQNLGIKGYFNDNLNSISNDEALSLYANGKAAMKSAGDWEESVLMKTAPEVAKVTEIAGWSGPADSTVGDSYELSCAWGFSVSSKTEDEAMPYIIDYISHYALSEEWGQYMLKEKSRFVPWKLKEFDTSNLFEITKKRLEYTDNATPCLNWDSTLDASVKDVYQKGLQALLIDAVTPEELAEEMQMEYEMVQ